MRDVAFTLLRTTPRTCAERRGGPRKLTLMRVGLIHASEGKEFCLVKNISADGLMARVYRSFQPGEEARVELTTGHVLIGDVVWASGVDIGVRFRLSVDVGNVLSSRSGPDSEKRPRLPRLDLTCPAVVRYGGRSVPVQVGNISQRGAKILGRGPIPESSGIVLSLPDLGCVHGTVRWSRGDEAGLFFNESLPLAVLACWVDGRRQLERRPCNDRSTPVGAGGLDR
ncbi:MAG TPA: PilZ domain-containing protein [Allosphingosinicella sp.]|nr:PilZ domain-containing protein [Allosphingosinicella sp.]